jgi:uncharacterized protein YbaR (Trm112 family)
MKIKPYEKMTEKEFEDWFMIPYRDENAFSSLKVDAEYSLWHGDDEFIRHFLRQIYEQYEELHGELDCSFMKSNDMDSRCDCDLCRLLWKGFDARHEKLTCKHCGRRYYIRKDIYDRNKDKYKNSKYNIGEYCGSCSYRLQLLDAKGKKKK